MDMEKISDMLTTFMKEEQRNGTTDGELTDMVREIILDMELTKDMELTTDIKHTDLNIE